MPVTHDAFPIDSETIDEQAPLTQPISDENLLLFIIENHNSNRPEKVTLPKLREIIDLGLDEVLISTSPLSGAAPIGTKLGFDISNKTFYYVDSIGNWDVKSTTQNTATVTDVDVTPGDPQTSEIQALVTGNGWASNMVRYIGDGTAADPEVAWWVDPGGIAFRLPGGTERDRIVRLIAPGDLSNPDSLSDVVNAMTTTQQSTRDELFKFAGSGSANDPQYIWRRDHNISGTAGVTIVRSPTSSLPPEQMEYKGTYDPQTNTPAILDATSGQQGNLYVVHPGAEVTLPGTIAGGATIPANTGGRLIHNGTQFEWIADAAAAIDQDVLTIAPGDLSDPTNLTDVDNAMTTTENDVLDEFFKFVGSGSSNDPDYVWKRDHSGSGTARITIIRKPATAGGMSDTYERVANKAARTAAPTFDGFTSFVETNQVLYIWRGSAYEILSARVSKGTLAERNSITEHEDGQEFYVTDLGIEMQWDSSISGADPDDKWVEK